MTGECVMLYWMLDKMGFNFLQQEAIMKIIWKVMAAVVSCAFLYGLYKAVSQIF